MPRLVVPLLVCLLLGLTACGGGAGREASEETARSPSPTVAAATPSPAVTADAAASPTVASAIPTATSAVSATPLASFCSGSLPPGLEAGQSRLQQLSIGVNLRTYLVYLPSNFDNTRTVPLVLNFHGLGGTAEVQEQLSGLVPIAEREGFILVTPQGASETLSWNFGVAQAIFLGGRDDFGFVGDLLDTLNGQLCIDQSRVYATGFSNGAFFASALACAFPGRFAAIAPVSGVYYPASGCPRAAPLLAFHGTADPVVPFEAGTIFDLLPYAGARASVASWARLGRCEPIPYPEPLDGADDASLEGYDCADGSQVGLVVVAGLGHLWPGFAAGEIWDFFSRYSLPG